MSGGGSLSASTGGSVTYTAPSVTVSTTVQIKATAAGEVSISKTVAITVQISTLQPGVWNVSNWNEATWQ